MSTKPRRIDGVDLSHHNPVTEAALRAAKGAGVRFVYHKATEGAGFVDGTYDARRKLAKLVGLPFGAYHFARPARGDASQEANHFLKIAKPAKGDLAPCLDLETTEGLTMAELRAWAAEWVGVVRKATGVEPVIYSPWDLGTKGLRWRPRYNASNTPPALAWDVWQFKADGAIGVPSSVAGLGRVDLNTFAEGITLASIPRVGAKPTPPQADTVRVNVAHASLQFSDTREQKAADVEAVFDRADARDAWWVTGTEAGEQPLASLVAQAAKRHGFRVFRNRGNWIAVRRSRITPGSKWRTGVVFVADKDETLGPGHDSAFPWVKFDNPDLGTIAIAAGHYPTKGQRPGSPNYAITVRYARKIGEWARRHGKGKALAFYQGDQNVPDRDLDTFRGEPLTTLGDELGKWPNTGHGPIDVLASYDKDGRVKGHSYRVLDDKRLPLHTDHYYIEGAYDVRVLRSATSSTR